MTAEDRQRVHDTRDARDARQRDELGETVRSVADLVVRVDERVQALTARLVDIAVRSDAQAARVDDLATRMQLAEAGRCGDHTADDLRRLTVDVQAIGDRVRDLEGLTGRASAGWRSVVAFLVQLGWVVAAAAILYRLHLANATGGP